VAILTRNLSVCLEVRSLALIEGEGGSVISASGSLFFRIISSRHRSGRWEHNMSFVQNDDS